ncbi:MAG: hypothetical protein A4E28_00475 [Methanocella sp. PtaU1.Bin125]|nr:MAG: hypothetical protein A4E28_00475 [Methanocella sp. PtaU1.Bin125]
MVKWCIFVTPSILMFTYIHCPALYSKPPGFSKTKLFTSCVLGTTLERVVSKFITLACCGCCAAAIVVLRIMISSASP